MSGYPVTDKFKESTKAYEGQPVRETAVEMLGEYEHGSVTIPNEFTTLDHYRVILEDFVITYGELHSQPK